MTVDGVPIAVLYGFVARHKFDFYQSGVRLDGKLATFRSPGKPDRPVALRRMDPPELLAEELRHLDEDDIYAATAKRLITLAAKAANRGASSAAPRKKKKKIKRKVL